MTRTRPPRTIRTEYGLFDETTPARETTAHSKLRKATRDRIRTMEKHGSRPYVKTNVTGKGYVGGWEDDKGAIHDAQRVKLGNVGEADLEVLWFGQGFMFEIKAGSDYQKPNQAKNERLYTKAGGIYLIVRAPHEATDAMLQWAAQSGRVF